MYRVWVSMKQRCHNPKSKAFGLYGARGIGVCDRWLHSFANFDRDMGPRPPGLTVERIDNDGPYSPDNCRWATRAEQNRNRRGRLRFTFQGRTQILAEWAREFGISSGTLRHRLLTFHWPIERALTAPPDCAQKSANRYLTFRGETLTVVQWATRLGIKHRTLTTRLNKLRWPVERALSEAVRTA